MLADTAPMFQSRVSDRSLQIGIVGQGYVGLPLALAFLEAGFGVLGFDTDPNKVALLQSGQSYIRHLGPERLRLARDSGRYSATGDFDRLASCDVLLICVPTPLGPHREPDNSYLHATVGELARRLRPGQLIIVESTTYPGMTEEELLPLLTATGLRCPQDFWLAFSPEREDPGNAAFTLKNTPKVVGGVNPESTDCAVLLYQTVVTDVVPLPSARLAESVKLLENIYRSVNIALVNELKMLFDRMGLDIWQAIAAASTKPFGYSAFYPGPGLGGHCIPLDPFFLSWKAAEFGVRTRFIELAGEINSSMPAWVVKKTTEALNADGKALRGSRVLVLGLAYKANIDDDRESPAYAVMGLLQAQGAEIAYCDPHFPEARQGRHHQFELSTVPCSADEFGGYDAVVLVTAHDEFLEPRLYSRVRLFVDTRGALDSGQFPPDCRYLRA